MDALEEIRGYIDSTLDGPAADALLERVPAPALCAALTIALQATDDAAISDTCLVIRHCALLASQPQCDDFSTHLLKSGVIAQLEGLVFADDCFIRAVVVYTLGKIGSTGSLPILQKAFAAYRDTDPLLVPHLIFESVCLGADEWDLIDQALASPVYPTRWSIIDRLGGLDGDALDEDAYDRRRLRYLEALRRDENRLVRDEAAYRVQVLTTSIPRDLPRGERRRRRKALYALEPTLTFLTCSQRFNNLLHQLGRQSYTVKEFEGFIDLLQAAPPSGAGAAHTVKEFEEFIDLLDRLADTPNTPD